MTKSRSYIALIAVSVFAASLSGAQTQKKSFQKKSFGFNASEMNGGNLSPGKGASQVTPSDGALQADGAITPIPQPTPDYVARTTVFAITEPDLTTVSSRTDPASGCTVTFSPPLQVRTVPGTWASWGSPPDTESSTPRILYTNGATSLTLTFSACNPTTIGFEAEPNPFMTFPMTATFFNDAVSQGSITRDVSGQGGALLFAADGSFNRVVFSSSVDFAIAQVRFEQGVQAILQGQVTDDTTGDGIQGARIEAVGGVTRSALTNAMGNYTLFLPEDTYDVTASAFGYMPQTVGGITVSPKAPTIQDFALTLGLVHSVSGTVTNSATGLPIAGAQVRILGTPLPPATTDANGMYQFPIVAEGTYNIQATAPGFLASTQSIVVDQDLVVDFALDSAADCARLAGNLVVNCGFETGDFTGWTRSGDPSFTSIDTGSAHSGSFGLDTGPTSDLGFIAQNLATTTGGSYSLCYWLLNLGGTPNRFQVSWGGTVLRDDSDLPQSDYTQYCMDVVAPSDSTELKFGFLQVPSFFHFDDVSVAPQ